MITTLLWLCGFVIGTAIGYGIIAAILAFSTPKQKPILCASCAEKANNRQQLYRTTHGLNRYEQCAKCGKGL